MHPFRNRINEDLDFPTILRILFVFPTSWYFPSFSTNLFSSGLFSSSSQCLKIIQNVAFEFFQFWYFQPIFDRLIWTCLIPLFNRQNQVFKNWMRLFCDFQPLCLLPFSPLLLWPPAIILLKRVKYRWKILPSSSAASNSLRGCCPPVELKNDQRIKLNFTLSATVDSNRFASIRVTQRISPVVLSTHSQIRIINSRTKIGGKCQNRKKMEMRHFWWFSNT